MGSSSPGQEVKVAPCCPSMGLRVGGGGRHIGTMCLPKVVWDPPPHNTAPGEEQAGGNTGRSQSHQEWPPRHGTDLVPALLSTDELRAAQRVFRNQNRMFPGCQPATQGYQA